MYTIRAKAGRTRPCHGTHLAAGNVPVPQREPLVAAVHGRRASVLQLGRQLAGLRQRGRHADLVRAVHSVLVVVVRAHGQILK